ncbi:hypothetical protein IWQ61_001788 [Dispira simplex]|nr:hypothetical protein IWQ61_001788 [Dispira simplex]
MYESAEPKNRVPGFREAVTSFPDVFRLRGSVVGNILPNVLSITLFATLVAVANDRLDSRIGLPNTIVPSFSVVLGLLLVFRSNSAYDRYWEGRRVWSILKTGVRNVTRTIWLGVSNANVQEQQEKLKIIRYMTAFAVATKHYLRGENSVNYPDLVELLPESFRDHYVDSALGTSVQGGIGTPQAIDNLIQQEAENGHHVTSRFRTSGAQLTGSSSARSGGSGSPSLSRAPTAAVLSHPTVPSGSFAFFRSKTSLNGDSNGAADLVNEHTQLLVSAMGLAVAHDLVLPLQLIFQIQNYVYNQRRANNVDPQTANLLNSTLATLVDSLGSLERILITPIPLAYRIHLKQSLYLYCCLLPFTLIDMHYLMIPVVTAIAFTLFGIDGIGQEIENPFGYDINDLPLDRICEDLRREMDYVIRSFPANDAPAF